MALPNDLCYIRDFMAVRLTPEEIAAVQARRAQARANSAVEGLTITPAQEALFAQFDAEGLSHDERRRRLILHIKAGQSVPAE